MSKVPPVPPSHAAHRAGAELRRYAIASVLSATISVGLPIVLHEKLSVIEETAVAIGQVTAFVVNFSVLRAFVFGSDGHKWRELGGFALTAGAFRGIEYGVFLLAHSVLRIHYMMAIALMLSSSAIGKFLVYRSLVFRGRRVASSAGDDGDSGTGATELESQNRTYHRAQDHMELLPNYYRWTYRGFLGYLRGDVVELGCGAGMGIATYVDRVSKVYAVDYNDELMRRVAQRFPSDKVVPLREDLTGSWDQLDGVEADAVIMMDVLEHFADDRSVVEKAWTLLKPEGHLLVKVPARSAMFSNMDRASGHFRRYDAETLQALMKTEGFESVRLREINPIGAVVYRFRSNARTNFSRTFSAEQLRVINALLPLLRWFDGLPIGGLSVTGVFRKPATAPAAPRDPSDRSSGARPAHRDHDDVAAPEEEAISGRIPQDER